MKQIRIALTGHDLLSLDHQYVVLRSTDLSAIFQADLKLDHQPYKQSLIANICAEQLVKISAVGNELKLSGINIKTGHWPEVIIWQRQSPKTDLCVQLPQLEHSYSSRSYPGTIIVAAKAGSVRVFVECCLEAYVTSVLHSEIPAHYHLETIKAQAVAARTYALNPRVDHSNDHCQVCDSFLCCQYFLGNIKDMSSTQIEAAEQTSGQIILYHDKPILALFSSCAGGHTENFETCFSDRVTNSFPPPAIPYLRGVPEVLLSQDALAYPNEQALSKLWRYKQPETIDAWAPQFRWSVRLTSAVLEANMHHVIESLLIQKDTAPFVIPPCSCLFGEIESFTVEKRGIGGTAIVVAIQTSKGTWRVQKELVIRSLFRNTSIGLSRLKSARIYFEHERDKQGFLKSIAIYGLGSGHGVGLQQTGAEGLARFGNRTHKQILAHYFTDVQLAQM